MRFKATIIASVLLVLFLGLAYVLNLREQKIKQIKEFSKRIIKVEGLKKEDILRFKIRNKDKMVVYEKKGERWVVKGKEFVDLDGVKVNDFLDAVIKLSYSEKIGKVGENALEDFGLHPAKKEVVIWANVGGKEKSFSVVFGTKNPVGDEEYVLSDDGLVYLVSVSFEDKFREPLKVFRKRDIVDVNINDVKEIELQNDKGKVKVVYVDGKWKMEEHPNWLIGDDEVEGFVRDMDTLFVRDFVSDDKEKALESLGLDKWFAMVKFLKKDGSTVSLYAYKKQKKLYVVSSNKPTLYLVDSLDVKKFERGAIFFRDKDILPFMSFDITKITFYYPGYSFSITKDEKKDIWSLDRRIPKGKKLSNKKIDDILGEFDKLRVYKFVDDITPDLGFRYPQLRVRIEANVFSPKTSKKEKKSVMLFFGKSGDFGVYVMRADRKWEAYLVKENVLQKFPKNRQDLLEDENKNNNNNK